MDVARRSAGGLLAWRGGGPGREVRRDGRSRPVPRALDAVTAVPRHWVSRGRDRSLVGGGAEDAVEVGVADSPAVTARARSRRAGEDPEPAERRMDQDGVLRALSGIAGVDQV